MISVILGPPKKSHKSSKFFFLPPLKTPRKSRKVIKHFFRNIRWIFFLHINPKWTPLHTKNNNNKRTIIAFNKKK